MNTYSAVDDRLRSSHQLVSYKYAFCEFESRPFAKHVFICVNKLIKVTKITALTGVGNAFCRRDGWNANGCYNPSENPGKPESKAFS